MRELFNTAGISSNCQSEKEIADTKMSPRSTLPIYKPITSLARILLTEKSPKISIRHTEMAMKRFMLSITDEMIPRRE